MRGGRDGEGKYTEDCLGGYEELGAVAEGVVEVCSAFAGEF
jgi:hypothetical protein